MNETKPAEDEWNLSQVRKTLLRTPKLNCPHYSTSPPPPLLHKHCCYIATLLLATALLTLLVGTDGWSALLKACRRGSAALKEPLYHHLRRGIPAHNAPLTTPETLGQRWVGYFVPYVSSSGTRGRLCGKCVSYVPPGLFHYPNPPSSQPSQSNFLSLTAADTSCSGYNALSNVSRISDL
jgi:hypothetical protein